MALRAVLLAAALLSAVLLAAALLSAVLLAAAGLLVAAQPLWAPACQVDLSWLVAAVDLSVEEPAFGWGEELASWWEAHEYP
jgi:hypothetical protein